MATKGAAYILQMHDTTRRILMIIGVILVVGGLLLVAYRRQEGVANASAACESTCNKACLNNPELPTATANCESYCKIRCNKH